MSKRFNPIIGSALAAIALLAGCAQQPVAPPAEPVAREPEAPQREAAPVRPFTSETLYALLAAELAGGRELFDIALSNYVQQAHLTRDPQVAARATLIARFMNADKMALDTALLWAEVAPDDSEAQLAAALALIEADRLQEAFELARRLHSRGDQQLFQNIAASSASVTDIQREQLLEDYLTLLEEYPDNQQLLIGAGLLLQQQQQHNEALRYARRALELEPDSVHGTILLSSLLLETGESELALEHLERLLERRPDNIRLRLHLARTLTQLNLAGAQEQFRELTEMAPHDPELRMSLALVAFEREDFPTATEAFEALLDDDRQMSSAHYYLGRIAEQQGDLSEALTHYLRVQDGDEFFSATINALRLFGEQGDLTGARQHMQRLRIRFPEQAERLYLAQVQVMAETDHADEADAVLEEGLEAHPTSVRLLYARAMMQHQRGNLAGAEADLRSVIKYEPNNAAALNALGYILTDETDRHEEAYELISHALSIEPDDPAIIDSMGWVHYRMGEPEKALEYLQRAMDMFPDHEIAAHLGEVLWILGDKEQAREIWRQGLELKPDSPLIDEAMERLTGE